MRTSTIITIILLIGLAMADQASDVSKGQDCLARVPAVWEFDDAKNKCEFSQEKSCKLNFGKDGYVFETETKQCVKYITLEECQKGKKEDHKKYFEIVDKACVFNAQKHCEDKKAQGWEWKLENGKGFCELNTSSGDKPQGDITKEACDIKNKPAEKQFWKWTKSGRCIWDRKARCDSKAAEFFVWKNRRCKFNGKKACLAKKADGYHWCPTFHVCSNKKKDTEEVAEKICKGLKSFWEWNGKDCLWNGSKWCHAKNNKPTKFWNWNENKQTCLWNSKEECKSKEAKGWEWSTEWAACVNYGRLECTKKGEFYKFSEKKKACIYQAKKKCAARASFWVWNKEWRLCEWSEQAECESHAADGWKWQNYHGHGACVKDFTLELKENCLKLGGFWKWSAKKNNCYWSAKAWCAKKTEKNPKWKWNKGVCHKEVYVNIVGVPKRPKCGKRDWTKFSYELYTQEAQSFTYWINHA
jgi:hypothetical protein